MHCHSFHGARHHNSVLSYSLKNDSRNGNKHVFNHSHKTDIVDADAYLCVKGVKSINNSSSCHSDNRLCGGCSSAILSMLILGGCISLGGNPLFSIILAVGVYQLLKA